MVAFLVMRICYAAESEIPSHQANGVQVMKMCEAFSKSGHDVVLFVPSSLKFSRKKVHSSTFDSVYSLYGVDKCFKIKQIPVLKIPGGKRLYGLVVALSAKLRGANLLYGRCLQSSFFGAVLQTPVMLERHVGVSSLGKLSQRMFEKLLLLRSFKQLIVISDALWQDYRQQYDIPENLLTLAPDAAEQILTSCVDKSPVPKQLHVGYAGSLYPGKGIELIIQLAKRCPWAKFHIVGGEEDEIFYWQEQALKQFKNSKPNNIIFYGYLPHSKIASFLIDFDVLVAPYQRSVLDCSGKDISRWLSPLKLFEYMRLGKPILVSDLSVLNEVVSRGRTAIMCQPDDIEDWVEQLTELRDKPLRRKLLGLQARKTCSRHFTWDRRVHLVMGG